MKNKLLGLLDQFYVRHTDFENQINSAGDRALSDENFYATLHQESHRQAAQILELVDLDDMTAWQDAAETLRSHQLHKDYLLQSDFIEQAFRKPNGYAGDKDLMLIICENRKRGKSPYAILKNQIYHKILIILLLKFNLNV